MPSASTFPLASRGAFGHIVVLMSILSEAILDSDFVARFSSKFERLAPDECWPWRAGTTRHFRGSTSYKGRTISAPRVALSLALGRAITDFACHSCDNPNCVNPSHLWEGTHIDNMRDAARKGRVGNKLLTHCPKGHFRPRRNEFERINCRICFNETRKLKRLALRVQGLRPDGTPYVSKKHARRQAKKAIAFLAAYNAPQEPTQ